MEQKDFTRALHYSKSKSCVSSENGGHRTTSILTTCSFSYDEVVNLVLGRTGSAQLVLTDPICH